MNSKRKNYRNAQVVSLLLARVFYSANWFNIAAIFFLIALDLEQDISRLGLVTASFIIGVGIFQVPAGILAAKYGANKIAVFGILLASFCALLTGVSNTILQIAILRFVVGMGMACFFGPSVILISQYLGRQYEGLGIGLINSAHAIGGIIGIFGWVILAQLSGWRSSLVIGGALGLVTGLVLIISVLVSKPKIKSQDDSLTLQNEVADPNIATEFPENGAGISLSGLRRTIFNRSLVILGLTLLSFQAGSSIILTFVVYYLGGSLKIDFTVAGFIGSLNLIIALLFSPIFGRVYDRTKKAKRILIISGLAAAFSIWGMSVPSIFVIIPSMIVSAIFLAAGFVIVYAEAKRTSGIQHLNPQYQTLAVSYVNGISLFGAFWIPVLFSLAVDHFGFSFAWLLGGLIVLIFVLPAFKLK
ncbi:MAG TPA: MFS transporter [Nitrososphaeraceae archaeon]|jgi:MFS family permease|nr:MFS transporter [Nitrososphaeraceae archaeon]